MEGSGAFEGLSGRDVEEMKIATIPISKVHPAAYNPRKDLKPSDPEYQRLAKAVDKFGMVEPLVWNERSGNLVGGHQRFKILKQGGAKTVEVSIVDLDDVDEKALNLALNKQGGAWDFAALSTILEEFKIADFDMEIAGFDPEELQQIATYSPTFDAANDPRAEWTGMPDFNQQATAFRTIYVHFKNQGEVDQFAALLKKTLTDKTRYVWFGA